MYADKALVSHAVTKINDGDVVMTYAYSHVVLETLLTAHRQGRKFEVIIIDARRAPPPVTPSSMDTSASVATIKARCLALVCHPSSILFSISIHFWCYSTLYYCCLIPIVIDCLDCLYAMIRST